MRSQAEGLDVCMKFTLLQYQYEIFEGGTGTSVSGVKIVNILIGEINVTRVLIFIHAIAKF